MSINMRDEIQALKSWNPMILTLICSILRKKKKIKSTKKKRDICKDLGNDKKEGSLKNKRCIFKSI